LLVGVVVRVALQARSMLLGLVVVLEDSALARDLVLAQEPLIR